MLNTKATAYRKMSAANEDDKEEKTRLHTEETERGHGVDEIDAVVGGNSGHRKLLYRDFIPELDDYDPNDESSRQEQFR